MSFESRVDFCSIGSHDWEHSNAHGWVERYCIGSVTVHWQTLWLARLEKGRARIVCWQLLRWGLLMSNKLIFLKFVEAWLTSVSSKEGGSAAGVDFLTPSTLLRKAFMKIPASRSLDNSCLTFFCLVSKANFFQSFFGLRQICSVSQYMFLLHWIKFKISMLLSYPNPSILDQSRPPISSFELTKFVFKICFELKLNLFVVINCITVFTK